MATRMSTHIDRRASLPLTPRDVADLDRLRESPSARARLSLPDGEVSESLLLHAVFEAGVQAIDADVQDRGYAELAAQYRDTPEGAERHALRRTPARFAED